jgi:hypothetical protein
MAVSKQWTLIRSWLRRTYNKEVHEFFRDLPEDIDPDNGTGRSTSKAVCLIGANDSQGIVEAKRRNFDDLKERAGLKLALNHEWVSLPGDSKKNKPQVQLWFHQKSTEAIKSGLKDPKKVRISFRVMQDWTLQTNARLLAREIRNTLTRPSLFHFSTGRFVAYYKDITLGYEFKMEVTSEAEGKRVIEKIMSIQNHSPTWRLLSMSEKPDLQTTPEYETVLGRRVEIKPSRQQHEVYFRYSVAKVEPLKTDFPLVDVSGKYPNALYRADGD